MHTSDTTKALRKKDSWAEKIRNKFLEQHDLVWATEQEWTAKEKSIVTYKGR